MQGSKSGKGESAKGVAKKKRAAKEEAMRVWLLRWMGRWRLDIFRVAVQIEIKLYRKQLYDARDSQAGLEHS